jgi:hypothetical protein
MADVRQISDKCPACNVSLYRVTEVIGRDIVFCSECGAGGLFRESIEEGKGLTPGYLTKTQINHLMRQMGQLSHTRPRNVISPVMARSRRTGIPVITETMAVTMATPAEGPSFGVAPSGT